MAGGMTSTPATQMKGVDERAVSEWPVSRTVMEPTFPEIPGDSIKGNQSVLPWSYPSQLFDLFMQINHYPATPPVGTRGPTGHGFP